MWRSFRFTILLGVIAGPMAAQQPNPARPDSALIAAGKAIYGGRGLCVGCHGVDGEGMLGETTQLDAGKPKWLHHDGTLAGIITVITNGVDGEKSVSGQVMPARGGSRLTDAQIRAVAAYVQALHARPLPRDG